MPLFTDELREFAKATDAYAAYTAYVKRIGDKAMSEPVFVEFWRGLKGLPRDEAKPPRKTLTHKENAIMAASTTTRKNTAAPKRRGRLVSPFIYDDPDVAFAAYKKMPHTKSPNARVMSKREFMKEYPGRHEAAIAKQDAKVTNAPTPAESQSIADVLGDSWLDADQGVIDALVSAGYTMPEVEADDDEPTTDGPDPDVIVALVNTPDALKAYLATFEGVTTTTQQTTKRSQAKRYRQRTAREDLPGDGNAYATDDEIAPASNAVLWALNTEGLLSQAYERAEENGDVLDTDNANGTPYITQACGKAVLAEVFGPLPQRDTNGA